MVDEIKKQMRRFEQLIGLKGKFSATSRESMEKLIDALDWKYKRDVENSLRLHRLEFFRALVEEQRRKKDRREKEDVVSDRMKLRSKKQKEDEEEPEKEKAEADLPGEAIFDEVVRVDPKDIDDWKDLVTLSRIYYQMEHPRSKGLVVKRRIAKKKKTEEFKDMDFIEWRAAQCLRLRDLEEWAQRRSDARLYARQLGLSDRDLDENGELSELFELLDPSGRKYEKKLADSPTQRKKSSGERPFKFQGDCVEDWTESYSDDSERSDIEDFVDEIEDFPDDLDKKMAEFDEVSRRCIGGVEDVSAILSRYPEFSKYRDPAFEEMDRAKTFEEWFELYKGTRHVREDEDPEEPATEILDTIAEGIEEEQEKPEQELAAYEVAGKDFGGKQETMKENELVEKAERDEREFGEERETAKENESDEQTEQEEVESEREFGEERENGKENESAEETEQEEVESEREFGEERETGKENESSEELEQEEVESEREFGEERENGKENESAEETEQEEREDEKLVRESHDEIESETESEKELLTELEETKEEAREKEPLKGSESDKKIPEEAGSTALQQLDSETEDAEEASETSETKTTPSDESEDAS